MQVVMNKCFSLILEIKIVTNPSCRFREKHKILLPPTHFSSEKNDVTEPKARLLW